MGSWADIHVITFSEQHAVLESGHLMWLLLVLSLTSKGHRKMEKGAQLWVWVLVAYISLGESCVLSGLQLPGEPWEALMVTFPEDLGGPLGTETPGKVSLHSACSGFP